MSESGHSITTLLFDWDGTLADSAPLGLDAFQKAFADLGFLFSTEIYEATYSPNWYSIYDGHGLPKAEWKRADDLWMKHYGSQTAELVAGADKTLRTLHERGYRLGVVTSGTESRVVREIEHADLAGILDVVVCNEHVTHKKPDPEGLEIALKRLGGANRSCGYVGDAPEDIEMGRRAGLFTVGVESAYPTNLRLVDESPDLYVGPITNLLIHFPPFDKSRD